MRMFINLLKTYMPHINVIWLWVVLIIFICIFLFSLLVQNSLNNREHRLLRSASIAFVLDYIVLLFAMLVLSRKPSGEYKYILIPFRSYLNMISNSNTGKEWRFLALFNVMLFIPFGFLLTFERYTKNRNKKYIYQKKTYFEILIYGFTLSLVLELLQLILQSGVFEVDDLIHNSCGTIIGAYAFSAFIKIKDVLCTKTSERQSNSTES